MRESEVEVPLKWTVERTCGNCAFNEAGLCHRNPPQVVVNQPRDGYGGSWSQLETQFPSVASDDWCGEYARRTERNARK